MKKLIFIPMVLICCVLDAQTEQSSESNNSEVLKPKHNNITIENASATQINSVQKTSKDLEQLKSSNELRKQELLRKEEDLTPEL